MMVLPAYMQFCTHQFTPSLAGEDQCNNINNEVVIVKQTRHCMWEHVLGCATKSIHESINFIVSHNLKFVIYVINKNG